MTLHAQNPIIQSRLNLIDIWIRARMAYRQQPGLALALVHDQEVLFLGGFGVGNLEDGGLVSAESIFRIASHSKLFTAIAVMQLRDAGKLRLNDAITTHLPWFKINNRFPDAPPITIFHLLNHISGLSREAGSGYWIDYDFPTAKTVQERVPDLTTAIPPENRHKYSNFALALAGEVVVTASGQTFDAYVTDHILKPLQMQHTSVIFPDSHRSHLVTGYGRRMPDGTRETLPFIDAKGMAAATGLSSSVGDMVKFLQWQLRLQSGYETEVLKAATLREMQRVHWVEPSWKTGSGIGFGIVNSQVGNIVGHGGAYPGYLTYTGIQPESKLGVSCFTNSLDGEGHLVAHTALKWLVPAVERVKAGEGVPDPPPHWQNLTGTYRTVWGDSHVLIWDGTLALTNPTLDNPTAFMFTLAPNEDGTFTMEGVYGNRPIGESIEFALGEDGAASRMKIGDTWTEKTDYKIKINRG